MSFLKRLLPKRFNQPKAEESKPAAPADASTPATEEKKTEGEAKAAEAASPAADKPATEETKTEEKKEEKPNPDTGTAASDQTQPAAENTENKAEAVTTIQQSETTQKPDPAPTAAAVPVTAPSAAPLTAASLFPPDQFLPPPPIDNVSTITTIQNNTTDVTAAPVPAPAPATVPAPAPAPAPVSAPVPLDPNPISRIADVSSFHSNTRRSAAAAFRPSSAISNLPGLTPLSPQEIAELRQKFQEYDTNRDGTMDLYEITRFLGELEFTYNDDYILQILDAVFGIDLANVQKSKKIRGKLQFEEFLEFMRIFYSLHDSVVGVIEEQFLVAFGQEATDEAIAALCPFLRFNDQNELDFSLMNEKLIEAVEAERAEQAKQNPSSVSDLKRLQAAQAKNLQGKLDLDDYNAEQTWSSQDEIDQRRMEARAKREEDNAAQDAIQEQKMLEQMEKAKMLASLRRDRDPAAADSTATDSLVSSSASPEATVDGQLFSSAQARSAMAFDASDEEFLRRSWDLLLRYFDRSNKGGIELSDASAAFRALGLDPSPERLRELFSRADLDHSGVLEWPEFRQYYHELFDQYLSTGFDLTSLKRIFKDFDEDGDGIVTILEFRHCIRTICGSEISADEIDELCKLTDTNDDSQVDFKEFMELIKFAILENAGAAAKRLIGIGQSAGLGSESDQQRRKAAMAHKAARSLIRKLIRASMPSPIEHIMTFANLPSTSRLSSLASYDHREEFQLSSLLLPVLDHTGLVYKDFALNPVSKALQPTFSATADLQNISAQSLGSSSISMNLNSVVNQRKPLNFILSFDCCRGVPIPAAVDQRSAIICRRLRLCLMDGNKPISNVHTMKAEWSSDEEDVWRFDFKKNELKLNELVARSASVDCSLLMELTCIVRKPSSEHTPLHALVPADLIEISCGFAMFEFAEEKLVPTAKSTKITRPIQGGNVQSRMAIREEEILARRTGWRAAAQKLQGKVQPKIEFTIAPPSSRPALAADLEFLSPQLLCPAASVEPLRLFAELLSFRVLQPPQPLAAGRIVDAELKLLLKIVDQVDWLFSLTELWNEIKKEFKPQQKKPKENGAPNEFIIESFRACVMRFWPSMAAAKSLIPPLILGVNDSQRVALFRLSSRTDPFTAFTRDGLDQAHASSYQHNPQLAYLGVYQPFNTHEVAFDHSLLSEEMHEKKRKEQQLNLNATLV